jgi:AmiR/NasT family two-component response regulator
VPATWLLFTSDAAAIHSGQHFDIPSPEREGAMATIVIADDDPDAADLVAYAFEGAGHTVRTVLDGESALRLIEELEPDVAVLDQSMPEMAVSVDRFLIKPVTPRQLTTVVADMLHGFVDRPHRP